MVGNILVAGGAVANVANVDSATLNQCTVTGNVVSSTITNGSDDGNGDGDSNTGIHEGKNNGNGVAGTLDVAGAGIDNESNTNLTIKFGSVSNNGTRAASPTAAATALPTAITTEKAAESTRASRYTGAVFVISAS